MTTRSNKPRPYGDHFEPAPTVGGELLRARQARRQQAAREAWVAEVLRRISRDLVIKYGPLVAEEVAAAEMERLLANFDDIADRWTPAGYVRQRVSGDRAFIDALRRDNAQRGAGARNKRGVVSIAATGRTETSGDDEKFRPLEDYLPDRADQFAEAAMSEEIQRALSVLSESLRTVVELVLVQGYEVTEAAEIVGIRRETASRRLSKAIRILRPLLADVRRVDD